MSIFFSLCSGLKKATYKVTTENLSPHMLRNTYSAHFKSRLRYEKIFWVGDNESKKAFRVQKRAIKIISGGANKIKSCGQIFKDYKILTVTA